MNLKKKGAMAARRLGMCQDQIPFRLVSVIILQSIKQTLATPIRKRISDPTRYERFTRKEERYLFVKKGNLSTRASAFASGFTCIATAWPEWKVSRRNPF